LQTGDSARLAAGYGQPAANQKTLRPDQKKTNAVFFHENRHKSYSIKNKMTTCSYEVKRMGAF
jgi:hypothetical protein